MLLNKQLTAANSALLEFVLALQRPPLLLPAAFFFTTDFHYWFFVLIFTTHFTADFYCCFLLQRPPLLLPAATARALLARYPSLCAVRGGAARLEQVAALQ